MTDRQGGLHRKSGKSRRRAVSSAKGKIINYTKQLVSLGNLQQTIVLNIQKEVENI